MDRLAQMALWTQQAAAMAERTALRKKRLQAQEAIYAASGLPDAVAKAKDAVTSQSAPMARPPRDAPQAHTVLRGSTITGKRDEEKDPLRASRSGSGGRASQRKRRDGAGATGGAGGGEASRKLAAGFNPAVVKVVSFASGTARATAMAQYVERDDVQLETQDGRLLETREDVAGEIKAWAAGFGKYKPTQDVAAARLQFSGLKDSPEGREVMTGAVAAAFAGHRHLYRIDVQADGLLEARAVVVLAPDQAARSSETGRAADTQKVTTRFRIVSQQVGTEAEGFARKTFDAQSEAAMKARIAVATGLSLNGMSLEPGATSHGRDGAAYRINRLVAKGAAINDEGRVVGNVAEVRAEARTWARSLQSRASRDTMHLVISAKAGTDHEKFKAAAREFLQDQYAGHQFMFALHADKEASGHLHAHAIIAMKSQTGEKLRSNKPDLEEWRYRFADHAQAQGLQIVATKAMDQASSRSYGPRDKAIIDVADHPRPRRTEQDRAYARDPQNASIIDNARRRVEKARTNPVRIPQTEPEKIAVNDSVRNWTALAKEQPQNAIVTDSLTRVTLASMSGNLLGVLQTHVEYLAREGKTAMAATSEEMRADLRVLNEAASSVSEILPSGTREQFIQQSARYLEKIAERVDLQRSVETRTPQAQAVLAPVVEEARRVAQVETREAEQAAAVADRARASDRRAEAKPDAPGGSPGEIDAKRAIVRDAEALAATERREAETARAATRQLTANAATPLTPSQADDARFERLRLHQADALRQIASQRASANEAENEAEQ